MGYYYSYYTENPENDNSWIRAIHVMNPRTDYCTHYDDIHFTEPKTAFSADPQAQAHITFVRGNRRSHYYLVAQKGNWIPKLRGRAVMDYKQEYNIAYKIISDVLEANLISKPLVGKWATDDEGWNTKATKMDKATSWQK